MGYTDAHEAEPEPKSAYSVKSTWPLRHCKEEICLHWKMQSKKSWCSWMCWLMVCLMARLSALFAPLWSSKICIRAPPIRLFWVDTDVFHNRNFCITQTKVGKHCSAIFFFSVWATELQLKKQIATAQKPASECYVIEHLTETIEQRSVYSRPRRERSVCIFNQGTCLSSRPWYIAHYLMQSKGCAP